MVESLQSLSILRKSFHSLGCYLRHVPVPSQCLLCQADLLCTVCLVEDLESLQLRFAMATNANGNGTKVPEVQTKEKPSLETLKFPPEYWQQLVQESYLGQVQDEPSFGEFGRLQHLNITHLVNEIATIKATIRQNDSTSEAQMKDLRRVLHEYGRLLFIHNIQLEAVKLLRAVPAIRMAQLIPSFATFLIK
jgi:hypothetical protein